MVILEWLLDQPLWLSLPAIAVATGLFSGGIVVGIAALDAALR